MIISNIRNFDYAVDRTVQESERGSISTFNDLSPEMVEEVRGVRARGGRLPTCHYLRFLVARQSDGDAESFCEEVIEDGADAKSWRVVDCIVGVTEERCEGIELSVAQYREALNGIDGERWFRTEDRVRSPEFIPTAGAGPGIVMRARRYWMGIETPAVLCLRSVVISPKYDILREIAERDLDVAIRRWMASVAAWWSSKYLLANASEATVEGVLAAYPAPVTPSADGMIALRALVREARSGDPRWPSQVGFIGPDEWYRP